MKTSCDNVASRHSSASLLSFVCCFGLFSQTFRYERPTSAGDSLPVGTSLPPLAAADALLLLLLPNFTDKNSEFTLKSQPLPGCPPSSHTRPHTHVVVTVTLLRSRSCWVLTRFCVGVAVLGCEDEGVSVSSALASLLTCSCRFPPEIKGMIKGSICGRVEAELRQQPANAVRRAAVPLSKAGTRSATFQPNVRQTQERKLKTTKTHQTNQATPLYAL